MTKTILICTLVYLIPLGINIFIMKKTKDSFFWAFSFIPFANMIVALGRIAELLINLNWENSFVKWIKK